MAKKPTISDEDKTIFRTAMRGIKRLTHSKLIPESTFSSIKRIQPPFEENNLPHFQFSDFENLDPVTSDDLLSFSRPGIQHNILRKLRTGQYNTQATLDLHGMTSQEAKEALVQFITYCQTKGLRYALVIHGRGHGPKPILKNKINHWLRQTDAVLAFCSATVKDGRSGAVYILLRKKE